MPPSNRSAEPQRVTRIICADWSKDPRKRAAYEALVGERVVRRVAADLNEVPSLLAYAAESGGSTLVAFDAPIGVPESFIAAVRARSNGCGVLGFMDWLFAASLAQAPDAARWSIDAPFFHVPGGEGALAKFDAAARAQGVDLRRHVDKLTGGRSAFITGGFPGTVGSAARDIWQGLVLARRAGTPFRVWPFEGAEDVLRGSSGATVAEIYPRVAYATALIDSAPRARMRVAKSDKRGKPTGAEHAIRGRCVETLLATRWSKRGGVTFEDVDRARANEDDFDALMTAAALLRCIVEALPLYTSPFHHPTAEGAILGTGSIDLTLAEKTSS